MEDSTVKKRTRRISNAKEAPLFNRLSIFGLIVISASITVIYIYNVQRVDNLLNDIRKYEEEYKQIKISNELTQSQVIELESADRIIGIATENLGMIKSDKAPIVVK